ncbi:MAG: HD domain-containing protein [Caldilineaceae bacterium]|nr:HD domain-containing protein [Caldilineaceae bacterium]MCB0185224.1 HD domain-containing protein [Caldilineaceae bacterium]
MNKFEREHGEPVAPTIGDRTVPAPSIEKNGTTAPAPVSIEGVRRDAEVVAFIRGANEALRALGYTEHGQRHAGLVGNIAANILERLDYGDRECELANIAGYLHDIGNSIHRENHALSGSLMAWRILTRMGMEPAESSLIMNAIGNHEEERGLATNPVSAALIIADKSDVHRSRVQNPDMAAFDIHDRVNYAATRSFVRVRQEQKVIALELEIDTEYAQVIEYFEIFLSRMTMVRQAVQFLGCEFQLIINDTRFS